MRTWPTAACLLLAVSALLSGRSLAADPFRGADPMWSLLHEPGLAHELGLDPEADRKVRVLLDGLDRRFFPLRNREDTDVAADAAAIMAEAVAGLDPILTAPQARRLAEIGVRAHGSGALLRSPLADAMRYTPTQRGRLEAAIAGSIAASAVLEKRAAAGEPRETIEREFARIKRDEADRIAEILTPGQRGRWRKAAGRELDPAALGRPAYRAPELIDSGVWVGGEPVTLSGSAGKVVVIHFYAFDCINCIRNYPAYAAWADRFRDDPLVILGIHTPETAAEADPAAVERRAAEAGFAFPVLVDTEKANWNAWGNSMWPSVYVVDKRGYLRYFWPGELEWQGAGGTDWMRQRIDELLAEPVGSSGE